MRKVLWFVFVIAIPSIATAQLYPKILPGGRIQTCSATSFSCGIKCAGDCNRDCVVTNDELLLCSRIKSNPKAYPYNRYCGYYKDRAQKQWVSLCDTNNDGSIVQSELDCMVTNIMQGCKLSILPW